MTDNIDTNTDNSIPDPPKPAMVVFKYEFKLGDLFNEIEMPQGAEILHLHGNLIWALVDKTKPMEKRTILCVRTGDEISDARLEGKSLTRIGSVYSSQFCGSVLHIFEVTDVSVVRLTPELKRWLRQKVYKDLLKAQEAKTAASIHCLLGNTAIAEDTSWLEKLEEQLQE